MHVVLHLHSRFFASHMTFSWTPSRLLPSGHPKCRAHVSEATGIAYKTILINVLACVHACMARALPYLEALAGFDWAALGKGHVLYVCSLATPKRNPADA